MISLRTLLILIVMITPKQSYSQPADTRWDLQQHSKQDYVIFVTLKLKQTKSTDYISVLNKYLKEVRKEPGTRTYKAHVTIDDPTEITIYAHFNSKESHEIHLNSPYTKEYLAAIKPLLEEGYPQRKKAIEIGAK